MKTSGGYITHRRPLVRSGRHAHTTTLERPISQLDLDAINAVQRTPWTINKWVLDVMLEAWTAGRRLAGLEVMEPLGLPPKVPAEVWLGMPDDDRKSVIARRSEVYAQNATIMGRSTAILDALSIADELRDKATIYYPYAKDFRGRIYPEATSGPQPQGNDISKSLLMFSNGEPLGLDGSYWLYVRAANCAGQDKLSMEDRVGWVMDHQQEIIHSASDPLNYDWWTKMDEPWQFLATCHELGMFWQLEPTSRQTFISHLPVPMDGSCNGIQHLAAMGLDPIGARATNLTNDPIRQDIYEEVAKVVRSIVENDVLAGVDAARAWHGNITRKTVKRSVMTTPYGVTDRGIRDQLLGDGLVPDNDEVGKGPAADYLRDALVTALGGTVQSARSIMAWLQTTADRLSKAGLAFDWTTPSGSTVRQGYHVTSRNRIRTLTGQLVLHDETLEAGLNTRKQSLGAAPNVIHSFDAAHLSLTVNAAAARGIKAFSTIHDSYGTHAGRTTELAGILRDQFVKIYEVDWLQRIADEVRQYAPHVKVADPPTRGTFDIRQVLDATYFFS
jgi:DNA-directed RNA polymerase